VNGIGKELHVRGVGAFDFDKRYVAERISVETMGRVDEGKVQS